MTPTRMTRPDDPDAGGRRFNDMRGWNLDPQTKLELRQKGVIKNYGTGGIMLTAAMPMDEIIIVPDEEVGKLPVRENLKTESIDQKTRFKTGWLVSTVRDSVRPVA